MQRSLVAGAVVVASSGVTVAVSGAVGDPQQDDAVLAEATLLPARVHSEVRTTAEQAQARARAADRADRAQRQAEEEAQRKAREEAAAEERRREQERREAEQRAREEAEQQAREEAEAEAAALEEAQDDPRGAAEAMLSDYGWGDSEFECLETLWENESGWDHEAENPSSGAYGIPQALPASKMDSEGDDYRENPVTQISWGLGYIEDRYDSPCSALGFWEENNWY
ncbi:MAG TPA: hypothetical protein VK053_05820 [Jiangellaceae bacterium]|nr:hypothetical protein [Jiangellaceae bacterium]